MPFTPFHLGLGATCKALAGRHLSFMVFGFSQVAMDLELFVRIMRGDVVVHGFTHTYVGATFVGVVSVLVGKPVCAWRLRIWHARLSPVQQAWCSIEPRIPWSVAAVGGFVGVYSHVLLDSIMHADMHPWSLFGQGNNLLHLLSVHGLDLLCLGTGVFGSLVLIISFVWKRWTSPV